MLPIGLGPVMGYILWHAGRGVPIEQLRLDVAAAPQFGGISQADIDAAFVAAASNAAATAKAVQLADTCRLGECLGTIRSAVDDTKRR